MFEQNDRGASLTGFWRTPNQIEPVLIAGEVPLEHKRPSIDRNNFINLSNVSSDTSRNNATPIQQNHRRYDGATRENLHRKRFCRQLYVLQKLTDAKSRVAQVCFKRSFTKPVSHTRQLNGGQSFFVYRSPEQMNESGRRPDAAPAKLLPNPVRTFKVLWVPSSSVPSDKSGIHNSLSIERVVLGPGNAKHKRGINQNCDTHDIKDDKNEFGADQNSDMPDANSHTRRHNRRELGVPTWIVSRTPYSQTYLDGQRYRMCFYPLVLIGSSGRHCKADKSYSVKGFRALPELTGQTR